MFSLSHSSWGRARPELCHWLIDCVRQRRASSILSRKPFTLLSVVLPAKAPPMRKPGQSECSFASLWGWRRSFLSVYLRSPHSSFGLSEEKRSKPRSRCFESSRSCRSLSRYRIPSENKLSYHCTWTANSHGWSFQLLCSALQVCLS